MKRAASLCAIAAALAGCSDCRANAVASRSSRPSPGSVLPAPSASAVASSEPPADAPAPLPPLDLPPATIPDCVERVTSARTDTGKIWTTAVREMRAPHGVTTRWRDTTGDGLWHIERFTYREGQLHRLTSWTPAESYTEDYAYDARKRLVRITSGGDRAGQTITATHTGSVPDGWTPDLLVPPCPNHLTDLDGDLQRIDAWRRWTGSGDGHAALVHRGAGPARPIDVRFRDGLPVEWTYTSANTAKTVKLTWTDRQLVELRCDIVTMDGEVMGGPPWSVFGAMHAAGRLQRLTLANLGSPADPVDVELDAHGRLLALVSGHEAVRLERDAEGREVERCELESGAIVERTVTRYACSERPPPAVTRR